MMAVSALTGDAGFIKEVLGTDSITEVIDSCR
jgi:hypothetical protein